MPQHRATAHGGRTPSAPRRSWSVRSPRRLGRCHHVGRAPTLSSTFVPSGAMLYISTSGHLILCLHFIFLFYPVIYAAPPHVVVVWRVGRGGCAAAVSRTICGTGTSRITGCALSNHSEIILLWCKHTPSEHTPSGESLYILVCGSDLECIRTVRSMMARVDGPWRM